MVLAYYFKQSLDGIHEAKQEGWRIFNNPFVPVREKLLAFKIIMQADETRFKLLSEGPSVLANPTIELQRATTTQPPLTGPPTTQGCEGCFDILTATQQSAFETEIPGEFPGISTIEQLCAHLVNLIISGENPTEALQNIDEILGRLQETGQISSTTHSAINACLSRLG